MFGEKGSIQYKDANGKQQTITKKEYQNAISENEKLQIENKNLSSTDSKYKQNQDRMKANNEKVYQVLMNQKGVSIDRDALRKSKQHMESFGESYEQYKKKNKGTKLTKKDWEKQKAIAEKQFNIQIKAQSGKIMQQSGGGQAAIATIDNIENASKEMATNLVSNANNMQQLSKTFKQLDSDLMKMIGAIKADPNVRRKLMQAELKGLQKQLNAWKGKKDANGSPTVGKDNLAAYNAQMDALDEQEKVAGLVADKFKALQSFSTKGGAQAIKATAEKFKQGNLKGVNALDTNQKGQNIDKNGNAIAKNEKGQWVKLDKEGKLTTEKVKDQDVKRKSFTDAIFDQAGKVAGSKDDKTINGAIGNIEKRYKEAQKSVQDEFRSKGLTIDASGKASGNEQLVKKYNEQIAQMKAAKIVAEGLVKSGGSLKTANQQLKIQMLKIQQQRVTKFKQFVDIMSKSIQTQKMFTATIQRTASQKHSNLAIMQHGSSDQLVKHMKNSLKANKKYYKQALAQNKSNQKALQQQINLIESTGKDSKGNVLSEEKKKQKLQQLRTAYTAAKGEQSGLKAEEMQKNKQIVMTHVQGIQSRYAQKKQNIEIRQDYAQNVSGTTQQWYKLQNQKLSCMKQQVQMLQAQLKQADKLGLSQQAKLQIKNKLMRKSVDLQKQRIGAQRNVFEKQLGSLLGGLQQQGAFKGFNQASVFGVGHGINQAGMAVAQGKKVKDQNGNQVIVGDSKSSYNSRLAAANDRRPTQFSGTKGDVSAVTDAVNGMGRDNKQSPQQTASPNSPTNGQANGASNNGGQAKPAQKNAQQTQNDKQVRQQAAETQQQKRAKQKQQKNSQLKDHDIWAKQLTVLEKILQIMKSGAAVSIDKTTGSITSNNDNKDGTDVKDKPNKVKNVKAGQSVQTGLVVNQQLQKNAANDKLSKNKEQQNKLKAEQRNLKDEKEILQSDISSNSLALRGNKLKQQGLKSQIDLIEKTGTDKDGKKLTPEQKKKKLQQLGNDLKSAKDEQTVLRQKQEKLSSSLKQKDELLKKNEESLKKNQAQGAQIKQDYKNATGQTIQDANNPQQAQTVNKKQPQIERVTKQQYEKASADLKEGFFSGKNKFQQKKDALSKQIFATDDQIKNAKTIQQKKKLQQKKAKLMDQYKQNQQQQKKAKSAVARYGDQQVRDKRQYDEAVNNLSTGSNGKTYFQSVRQRFLSQHNQIEQKMQVAKTPQEKAELQRRKAQIEAYDKQNNQAEERAKQVKKAYEESSLTQQVKKGDILGFYGQSLGISQANGGNLDAVYAPKQQKKQQGSVTVSQQNNSNITSGGQTKRIPFEDMSSDNAKGKINGYVQVQVVRRVVINSSDGNFKQNYSALQGSGSTS